ncbi:MAG TPA: hypothetical protein VN855_00630, partial [Candidatus Acidoferrum sp.]|nr:hypothetical protein [Candidatus Acidoferrum sp.]
GISDPRMDSSVENPPMDPEDNHSKGALQAIAQQIEEEGTPPASRIDAVDESDMPTSTAVEGNISRPEDFGQNIPQDMGAQGPAAPAEGDDEPELSDILEEGLNHEADGIQKEKAIRAVSQALMQFKGCKQELENIKMQAPQLYQASIGMLKAMIEMASLLGLGQAGPSSEQPSQLGQEQSALMPEQIPQEEQNDEWHDPFPTHPDHGGEGKPGHASSPKNPKPEGSGPPQQ